MADAWTTGTIRRLFVGKGLAGETQNSFWRCPPKKNLRVKRDAYRYIVISLLWLIPEFLAEAFRICTKETEMIHSHRLYNHHVRDQHWAALIFSDPCSWRFRLHCSRWSSDEWRPWWRLPAFFGLGLLIRNPRVFCCLVGSPLS